MLFLKFITSRKYLGQGILILTRFRISSLLLTKSSVHSNFGHFTYRNARWLRSAPEAKRKEYDTSTARFAQPDTLIPNLSYSQAWDRYTFVKNNPIKLTDPSGHIACWDENYDGNCNNSTNNPYGFTDHSDDVMLSIAELPFDASLGGNNEKYMDEKQEYGLQSATDNLKSQNSNPNENENNGELLAGILLIIFTDLF